MSENVYCNICGKEMWGQNGKYHCELCERPDVFGDIKIEKCMKECGNLIVLIPYSWWDSQGLPGRRTNLGHGVTICRECKCKDPHYNTREFLSIAHFFATKIIKREITYLNLELLGWPKPFIFRIKEIVNNWNNEGCNSNTIMPMLIAI
ncbi:MAG: hypothetical protein KKH41_01670 [Candidatus Thermoplasmatota archaeon]|nr:hypothetical protein [Euryarchaeota archaeon]MBU4032334.1 hypothetical protein [Candidatus Thermoplasmatota archaeon]MBU4143551.1 hypothetical protein [Candidatus Thermoplasmatota archaeon]MBU4591269.1 hypothetical protein [Candidatus Thermoplasmatota archaeon]